MKFKMFIEDTQIPAEEIEKAFKGLGKVVCSRTSLEIFDIFITVPNKFKIRGVDKKAEKIAKQKFNAKLLSTEIQAPWNSNRDEEDSKPWEIMLSFKY